MSKFVILDYQNSVQVVNNPNPNPNPNLNRSDSFQPITISEEIPLVPVSVTKIKSKM